jgi:hypothetical protein
VKISIFNSDEAERGFKTKNVSKSIDSYARIDIVRRFNYLVQEVTPSKILRVADIEFLHWQLPFTYV